ncbi:hypothetical protein CDL62_01925 [Alkalitalea saponilacus]|uniref:Uncharacterized protein n=1 Tax=Alkalitalea saponilacus TaxID=889453 RepID=A0A1T5EWH4_9BACT|nr:hypothetical protein CDL62_01925 [Alkalitalea saponilacus]SKB88169.1 hypothetical protein SAMN03080601_01430 [Alkalitalea saponilacus]
MRDIIISGKRIKTELYFLLIVWGVANLINAFSIWNYETSWVEMITFQPLILMITFFFYLLTIVVRVFISLVSFLVSKVKPKST